MVVLDAPLLYETKLLEYFCYPILVVYCDNNQEQLRRLMERNPEMSEEEALRRVSAQMPIGVKVRKADIAIDNSGTEKQLRKQVLDTVIPRIYQKLGYIDPVGVGERKED
jgi:dephospho-CoA kinase